MRPARARPILRVPAASEPTGDRMTKREATIMTSKTFAGTVFNPEAVATINRAYEGALASLGSGSADLERRTALAREIIQLARNGERDAERLSSLAAAAIRRGGQMQASAK